LLLLMLLTIAAHKIEGSMLAASTLLADRVLCPPAAVQRALQGSETNARAHTIPNLTAQICGDYPGHVCVADSLRHAPQNCWKCH